MRFVDFCGALGVELTPAQRVLCLVAFDRVEPCQLDDADREIARELFGPVDVVPAAARAVLAALCGARSGKSYILAAIYLLWRALLADLSRLAPGEVAHALAVCPDLRLGRLIIRYAHGAASGCSWIAPLISADGADGFTITRPDGHAVMIECLPATRGGSALRGRSLVAAVLDECSFFRDESAVVNDSELFRAVAPRVIKGGLVVLCSTAWGGMGLLADEIERNFGHPVTALACKAPTLLMRPEMADLIARERIRDPDNARREFDCESLADDSAAWPRGDVNGGFEPHPGVFRWSPWTQICDPGETMDAFVTFRASFGEPDLTPRYRQLKPPPGSGLSSDVFIGYELDGNGNRILEPQPERRLLRIAGLHRWTGPEVRQLGMDKLTTRLAGMMRTGGARLLVSDQRGAPYLNAMMVQRGVKFRAVNINATNKHESVVLIRSLLRDGQISIDANSPYSAEFRQQMIGYRRIVRSGGTFGYSGGNRAAVDDWAAALVTFGASLLLEEEGTPADQTRVRIHGSPTKTMDGRRHEQPYTATRY
jgi:hypothetical protein